MSRWRERCSGIIRDVLAATKGDPAARRKALIAAYPFGLRQNHPYKIWCDEIARQTGKKPPLGERREIKRARAEAVDANQGKLF